MWSGTELFVKSVNVSLLSKLGCYLVWLDALPFFGHTVSPEMVNFGEKVGVCKTSLTGIW